MFKKLLSNHEAFDKDAENNLVLSTKLAAYEVYIEKALDEEGNAIKNRDGSDRYYPVNDEQVITLVKGTVVKAIADNFFKKVNQIVGEEGYVEKVVRNDNSIVYYPIDSKKLITIENDVDVRLCRNECYRVLNETGYAIVDETEEETQKVLAVRPFANEDHKAETDEVVSTFKFRHKPQQN